MLDIEEIKNTVICSDCLEVMRQMPDKCVDLVLTDPPYGIGMANNPFRQSFEKSGWDNEIVGDEYFHEIQRISNNQIIWGGNYFPVLWANGCRGFLYWNKMNHHKNRCDGELAWTSFDMCSCHFDYMWDGNRYGFPGKINGVGEKTIRVHPTEKPVALMEWCLNKYSKSGNLILDCFGGSGSTAVACKNLARDYVIIEISPSYCETIRSRILQAETGVTVKEQKSGQKALFI